MNGIIYGVIRNEGPCCALIGIQPAAAMQRGKEPPLSLCERKFILEAIREGKVATAINGVSQIALEDRDGLQRWCMQLQCMQIYCSICRNGMQYILQSPCYIVPLIACIMLFT